MVIGKGFAWAHVPKTGGDATRTLFGCVPDLVLFSHDPRDPAKHSSFAEVGVRFPRLAMNLRRLPSQVLSWVNHTYRYGRGHVPRGTWMRPEDVIERAMPEDVLARYLDGGTLEITDWFRMEYLREDFTEFVSTFRALTEDETQRIRTAATKPPMSYDHDPLSYFTPDQIDELYDRNPTWARIEREVYGSLILPDFTDEDSPAADPATGTAAVPAPVAGAGPGATEEPA